MSFEIVMQAIEINKARIKSLEEEIDNLQSHPVFSYLTINTQMRLIRALNERIHLQESLIKLSIEILKERITIANLNCILGLRR